MKKTLIVLSLITLAGINAQAYASDCAGTVHSACDTLFPQDNTTIDDDQAYGACLTTGVKLFCRTNAPTAINLGYLKSQVLQKRAKQTRIANKSSQVKG